MSPGRVSIDMGMRLFLFEMVGSAAGLHEDLGRVPGAQRDDGPPHEIGGGIARGASLQAGDTGALDQPEIEQPAAHRPVGKRQGPQPRRVPDGHLAQREEICHIRISFPGREKGPGVRAGRPSRGGRSGAPAPVTAPVIRI